MKTSNLEFPKGWNTKSSTQYAVQGLGEPMRVRGLSGIRIGLRPVHLLGEVESNEPGTSTKLSGDEESCQQKFTATSLLSAKVSDLTWGKRKNCFSKQCSKPETAGPGGNQKRAPQRQPGRCFS